MHRLFRGAMTNKQLTLVARACICSCNQPAMISSWLSGLIHDGRIRRGRRGVIGQQIEGHLRGLRRISRRRQESSIGSIVRRFHVHGDDAGANGGMLAAVFVLLLVDSIHSVQRQHTLTVTVSSGGRCGCVETRRRVGVRSRLGRRGVVAGGGTGERGNSAQQRSAQKGEPPIFARRGLCCTCVVWN